MRSMYKAYSRLICLSIATCATLGCGSSSSLIDDPCSRLSTVEACDHTASDGGPPASQKDASLPDAGPRDASSPSADAGVPGADVPVVIGSTAPCLAAPPNTIYVDGDPDDPVHPGQGTYSFPVSVEGCGGYMSTPAELSLGCPAASGSDTNAFSFYFRSADGRPLKVGVYENALSTDNLSGYPFMRVGAYGAYGGTCDYYAIGRFQIEQLDLDAHGQAAHVLITFEQHCSQHEGALRGCIRYTQGSP